MDNSLVLALAIIFDACIIAVLILVVMDNSLVHINHSHVLSTDLLVLILVVMDNSLVLDLIRQY